MPPLPVEVWGLVFEQAHLTTWSRRPTLRNACLVCSAWAALAAPWLYRHVRIRRGLAFQETFDAFYTICQYRRDLARSVVSLELACSWDRSVYASKPAWVRNWTQVFDACREIRAIDIRPLLPTCALQSEFYTVLKTHMAGVSRLEKLQSLTLDLFPPHHSFVQPLADVHCDLSVLKALGRLSAIHLGIIDPRQHGDLLRALGAALRGASRLTAFHLTLHCTGPLSPECKAVLGYATSLRVCQSSYLVPRDVWTAPLKLRELTFKYFVGIFGLASDIPSIPTLRSLSVEVPRDIEHHHFRGLQMIVTNMIHGAELERLALQAAHDAPNRAAMQISNLAFVEALPLTLQVLHAAKVIVPRDVLAGILRRCRRLRGLSVSFQSKEDFERLDWETLMNARSLECFELRGWPYGDAREVSLFESTALKWMQKLPTLRHAAINGGGWFSYERPDQVRARDGHTLSVRKPWNSDMLHDYAVHTVVPMVSFHPSCTLL